MDNALASNETCPERLQNKDATTPLAGFPMDEVFASLCTRVFRVQTMWEDNKGARTGAVGTAFAIAKRPSNELILATAAHVLDFPETATVTWVVQQFDQESNEQRRIEFKTNASEAKDVPYTQYKYRNAGDVGLCWLPAEMEKGCLFSPEQEEPLVLIDDDAVLTTGARVGWAGFPAQVEEFLGRPALCYAEGVISALANWNDCQFYIVDGNNAPGFSGGPVWYWDKDRQCFRVLGVISQYVWENDPSQQFPGFCVFEPINKIKAFLNTWRTKEDIRFATK